MKQPNVTVYGSMTCSDTLKTRRYLDEHDVPYEFKDVDLEPEYNDYIAGLNGGKRVMPTLRVDNDTLVNPTEKDLQAALMAASAER